jgi:hypothetical protein
MGEREDRFADHLQQDIDVLERLKYNPSRYQRMLREHGAVGAARRLLADPRHTSYGFEKLWAMGQLERSLEFAVCLPWFSPLFTDEEVEEAERRLILHDFPARERVGIRADSPPEWTTP